MTRASLALLSVLLSGCDFQAAYDAYCARANCAGSPLPDAAVEDAGFAVPPFTKDSFCAVQAGVYCDVLVRCGELAAAEESFCDQTVASSCRALQGLPSAVNALGFSVSEADRCLAALGNSGCDALALQFAVRCAAVFGADAGLAEPCLHDGFCKNGGLCAGERGLSCGVCEPKRVSGQLCANEGECDVSHYCDLPTDGGAPRCQPKRTDSSPCARDEECQNGACNDRAGNVCFRFPANTACDRPEHCAAGMFCQLDPDAGTPVGSCAPRLASGARCVNRHFDDGCPPGETCLEGACKPLPFLSREDGAECEDDEMCQSYRCVGDSFQNHFDGRCQRLPGAGTLCAEGRCATGNVCINGTCQPRKARGDFCETALQTVSRSNGPCLLFLSCQGDGGQTGRCVRNGLLGEACADTNPCVEGYCDGGTCTPTLAPGQSCQSDSQCSASSCDASGTQSCASICF